MVPLLLQLLMSETGPVALSRPRRGPRVASYYDHHEFTVVIAPAEKEGRYIWPQVEVVEQAGRGLGLRAIAPLPTNTVLPYGGCVRRREDISLSERKTGGTWQYQIEIEGQPDRKSVV